MCTASRSWQPTVPAPRPSPRAGWALVCLYAFVRRQHTLPAPLLDMRLFRNRGFSASVLADLLTVLGLSGLIFFLSQFLQMVQGRSPLEAGLAELPAMVGAVGAGLCAGVAARRFSVRMVVAGGLGASGLALAGLFGLTPDTGYPLLFAVLLIVGVGAGFSFTVTADVILSSVPEEEAGASAAVSETAYELGAALGIALLGSIVTGIYSNLTLPAGLSADGAAQAKDSLAGAVEVADTLPGGDGDALLLAAQASFTDGLRIAAMVGAVVLLGAAVWAWRMLRHTKLATTRSHH
ncbi:putative MFS family arabinose efflux permease [Streptomyces sp. SPB162]|nr:MFS transporter [Streptomyces sp. SPB162]MDF9812179.1 putative MFS family arabinose efflux permease [Streptomyces sp. SPB162]